MQNNKDNSDSPDAPVLDRGLEERLAREARERMMDSQRDRGDETREA